MTYYKGDKNVLDTNSKIAKCFELLTISCSLLLSYSTWATAVHCGLNGQYELPKVKIREYGVKQIQHVCSCIVFVCHTG